MDHTEHVSFVSARPLDCQQHKADTVNIAQTHPYTTRAIRRRRRR